MIGGWGETLAPALRLQAVECFEKTLLSVRPQGSINYPTPQVYILAYFC